MDPELKQIDGLLAYGVEKRNLLVLLVRTTEKLSRQLVTSDNRAGRPRTGHIPKKTRFDSLNRYRAPLSGPVPQYFFSQERLSCSQ
jgi:hypothetical protein